MLGPVIKQIITQTPQNYFIRNVFMDDVTRTWNQSAFNLIDKQFIIHQIAIINIDSLQWVNTHLSYEKGNQLLQYVAKTLKANFKMVFSTNNRHFIIAMPKYDPTLNNKLNQLNIRKYFSMGIGVDFTAAEDRLYNDKNYRLYKGIRAPKGTRPVYFSKEV